VCVLDWALARPWGPTFLGSLPVAGAEGTLADRLGDVGPTVRAKTGTLTGTRALAGVIERADRRVTFAALLADLTGDHEASGHDYLDDLVRELVVASA
jgi:D-alanyl-D-alanine carboxypeptidase/D-alanyl-D-alanine-endopeptidase (penicillin-binding protein 4)